MVVKTINRFNCLLFSITALGETSCDEQLWFQNLLNVSTSDHEILHYVNDLMHTVNTSSCKTFFSLWFLHIILNFSYFSLSVRLKNMAGKQRKLCSVLPTSRGYWQSCSFERIPPPTLGVRSLPVVL